MRINKIVTVLTLLVIANISWGATLQLIPGPKSSQAYNGLLHGYYTYDLKLYVNPRNQWEDHSDQHYSFDPIHDGSFYYFTSYVLADINSFINSFKRVSDDSYVRFTFVCKNKAKAKYNFTSTDLNSSKMLILTPPPNCA